MPDFLPTRPVILMDAEVAMLIMGDDLLENITNSGMKVQQFGAFVFISNIAAFFEYGAQTARLHLGYKSAQALKETASDPSANSSASMQ